MRDGVPADPRTIRELLEAIRDRHAAFGLGPNSQTTADAVAALAQLDAAEVDMFDARIGMVALVPDGTVWELRDGVGPWVRTDQPDPLVPDSGVVLDPQHNDTP